jgi:hypothetical protein
MEISSRWRESARLLPRKGSAKCGGHIHDSPDFLVSIRVDVAE